jgi:hypothetical protein
LCAVRDSSEAGRQAAHTSSGSTGQLYWRQSRPSKNSHVPQRFRVLEGVVQAGRLLTSALRDRPLEEPVDRA